MRIPTLAALGVVALAFPAAAESSQPVFEELVAPSGAVDVGVDVNVNVHARIPAVVAPVVAAVEAPEESSRADAQLAPTSPRILTGSRWEGGILLELGRFGINHVGGLHVGLRGHVGRQLGPLRVGVEGTFAKFSGTDARRSWEDFGGELQRVGLGLRYRAAAENSETAFAVAGYIDVGVGRQRILWNGGGEPLTRSDLMIGFGYEIAGGRDRFGGMDMGVRFMATPTVDPGTPGCLDVCAAAAMPGDQTRDLSVMFVWGALFGS